MEVWHISESDILSDNQIKEIYSAISIEENNLYKKTIEDFLEMEEVDMTTLRQAVSCTYMQAYLLENKLI